MTVLFHLEGSTSYVNTSVMMYIGVFAYGSKQFELTFNPCNANINSLCPMRAAVPFEAAGIIPVSESDVANIPSLALSIPDFEGQAILRMFSNITQDEIACFTGVVTNGASFSHPAAVGSTLGAFAVIAVCASFVTALHGDRVSVMRKHYAHSLSVLLVFAVYQHVFFTRALSVNWPSVLPAFWSNYAWSAGMIYSSLMQSSINAVARSTAGNITALGPAASGQNNSQIGGGYSISQIYLRFLGRLFETKLGAAHAGILPRRSFSSALMKRDLANSSEGYNWYGSPTVAGLPLPGNFSSFAGTLSEENIPISHAFMTGFLWFLVLVSIVVFTAVALKVVLECLAALRWIRTDRLAFFRIHWLGYILVALLRSVLIAFFMLTFLSILQFAIMAHGPVTAIAASVFTFALLIMVTSAGYAYYYRVTHLELEFESDHTVPEQNSFLRKSPWISALRRAPNGDRGLADEQVQRPEVSWWRAGHGHGNEKSIHDDERFTKRFGWLTARFRRTRWWFFAGWLAYEFVRACWLAAAVERPLTQVFGLLAIEFVACIGILLTRPFEGQRLNTLLVYCLGFSKVVTLALSAAFDVQFGLHRITTTIIGIIIIVIQGLLTVLLLIAIVIGTVSSYMSLTRNTDNFKPMALRRTRGRYFKHIDRTALDVPRERMPRPPPLPPPPPLPEIPKDPYFKVAAVRRMSKIEDDDEELSGEHGGTASQSELDLMARIGSSMHLSGATQAPSLYSQTSRTSLPFGARRHRASWNSADFSPYPERDIAYARSGTQTPHASLPLEEDKGELDSSYSSQITPVCPTEEAITSTVGIAMKPQRRLRLLHDHVRENTEITSNVTRPQLRSRVYSEQLHGGNSELISSAKRPDSRVHSNYSVENIEKIPMPVSPPRSGSFDPVTVRNSVFNPLHEGELLVPASPISRGRTSSNRLRTLSSRSRSQSQNLNRGSTSTPLQTASHALSASQPVLESND